MNSHTGPALTRMDIMDMHHNAEARRRGSNRFSYDVTNAVEHAEYDSRQARREAVKATKKLAATIAKLRDAERDHAECEALRSEIKKEAT